MTGVGQVTGAGQAMANNCTAQGRARCDTTPHLMMPKSRTSACTGLKLTDSGFPIVKWSPT